MSVVGAEVLHTADDCADRTGEALAIGCVAEFFAFDSVLLGCEGEGDKGGGEQIFDRHCHYVGVMTGADLELDILKTERGFSIARGVCVFPWAE